MLQISESSDALRDLGATIVEANLALGDNRRNQSMKGVGNWATTIPSPTLITGTHEMAVPSPRSGSTTGVVVSAALTLGIPTGLYPYLHHPDWL